jgi:hypothetical protein
MVILNTLCHMTRDIFFKYAQNLNIGKSNNFSVKENNKT